MSIINTMLKDLDRRGVEYASSDDSILSGLEPNRSDGREERRYNPVVISVASVFAVFAMLAVGYYLSPYQLVSPGTDRDRVAVVSQPETQTPATVGAQTAPPVVEPEPAPPAVQEAVPAEPEAVVAAAPARTGASSPSREQPAQQKVAVAQPEAVKQQRQVVVQSEMAAEQEPEDIVSTSVSKKQRAFSAEEKSQQAYAEALTLYNQGSRQSAKASLQQALDHYPANREARALLAAIYLEDSKPEIASELIAAGLSINANDQQLLRLYLEAQVQSGNYIEAIAVMEQRLRLTQPEDFGYLAGLYQKNNDHVSAVKMYARALQLKPSNSIWWMGQGISLEMMQQYDEAIRSYQQSISTGRLSGKLTEYATSRIRSIKQLNDDSVS